MENYISRIANHVYVKGGTEAVKLYKEAFKLEEKGKPWLDDDGILVYQELLRNGEHFISVSEDKHLSDGVKREYPDVVRPTMMNLVYFSNEDDLRRAFELLYKDKNPCTGIRTEGHSVNSCDMIDEFGVLWHLCVPKDWNASFIPK